MSAVGVAAYDPRYRFADQHQDSEVTHTRVIVCLLEENYEAMQAGPTAYHDRATRHCIADLMQMRSQIAETLVAAGYHARVDGAGDGAAVAIPYAVEAGLGQLGLNGTLLTPHAGPRVRLGLVSTDAPLQVDGLADFGIPKICDSCRVCVRNCPANALSGRRRSYRGVEKAKVNAQRCAPVLAAANGYAVCQMVCPVQKYGLKAVYEEFERTGHILGRDTEALEGYRWIDGRWYSAGERPSLSQSFFKQPAWLAIDRPHPDPGASTASSAHRSST